MQSLLDSEGTPSFPELEDAEYLVTLLDEVGGVSQSGMGIAPVSWQELYAWLSVTNTEMSNWEITTLKAMSNAYCYALNESEDPAFPAPYTPEEAFDGVKLESKLLSILRAYSTSAPPLDEA